MPLPVPEPPLKSLDYYSDRFPEVKNLLAKCASPRARFVTKDMLETPANTHPYIFHILTICKLSMDHAGRIIVSDIYKRTICNLNKEKKPVLAVHCWVHASQKSMLHNTKCYSGSGAPAPVPGHGEHVVHISVMIETPVPTDPKWLKRCILPQFPISSGLVNWDNRVCPDGPWSYQRRDESVFGVKYRLDWFDVIATDGIAGDRPFGFCSSISGRTRDPVEPDCEITKVVKCIGSSNNQASQEVNDGDLEPDCEVTKVVICLD